LFILGLAFTVFAASKTQLETEFSAWANKNGQTYPTQLEYYYRLGVYADNSRKVDQLNRESNGGAEFALNKFADRTAEEFSANKGYVPRPRIDKKKECLALTGVAAPDSFDWSSKDKLTPVKDQQQCGSCWAFSATENIESVWMIAKDLTPANFKPLGPQQIVDCDTVDGGCNGGDTPTAFEYVIKAGGQEPESAYPYKAVNQKCHFVKADVEVTIRSYQYATKTKNESQMQEATATVSPLSICVDAEPWQFYSGGVMKRAQCGTSLDHCVQIAGYDVSANPPYWRVRNSWGVSWGEQGFIRLEFGQNTCGCAEEATTAVV